MAYTYAILDVSQATFDEISKLLREAAYDQCFDRDVIDMHGIALRALPPPAPPKPAHHWQFYMNGSFCERCGAQLGDGRECRP